jgi:hypothetical protein
MKIVVALAFAFLASAALPAVAETAEEAVGYAFLGLADGGGLVRGTTTMKWTEAGGSPAVFDGDTMIQGHPVKIKFTVTALNPCDYDITLEGPPGIVPGQKRLFGKVALKDVTGIAIAADGFHASVAGSGYCETGRTNPDCLRMDSHDLFGSVDGERHKAALAFLQTVCVPPKM